MLINSGVDATGSGAAAVALGASTVAATALGAQLAGGVGSADLPVMITVLNSLSGWALAAEGFMLTDPLLGIVVRVTGVKIPLAAS